MTDLAFLTQCAWKGSILMLAGFAASALLRRRSAALRHSVWVACFAALLALPVAILRLPPWAVLGQQEKPAIVAPAAPTAAVSVTTTISAPVQEPIDVPRRIWLAGAGMTAFWFLAGMLRTSWMVRRATPAPDAAELAGSLGIGRRVRVLFSEATPMPMTWGLFRPVVVLPTGAAEWPAARLRTVLLHELVHVRRLDLLAQEIGQAVCCLYWFHPLAWIMARQLRQEREQACDDAVLARGIPAPEYAGHLMDLVRALAARRNAWSHAPAMAEVSGLELRVRALLDSRRDRRPLNRRKGLAIAAAGAALLLPLAAVSETRPGVPTVTVEPAPVPAILPAPIAVSPRPVLRRKLLALAAAPAPPQAGIGSLSGTVRDPSGAVVPGCTVALTGVDGSGAYTMQTDATGQYRFSSVLAGKYNVEVRAPGFAAFKLEQLPVTDGNAAQINVNLLVGKISETVTVQGKRSATAAPPVPAVAQRIKVGGMVQISRLLRQPRPVYPDELQQLGVEGTVRLQAVISKEGIPIDLRAVPSSVDPRLVPLAMDAVSQWRYSPTLLNGEPVETATTIDVTFTLNQ
ncbi:MAG: M56 family metallopeptidase [Candidatus Sulfopaludibacter sp.]|nr:M56 family metallopeptidase [Candidatus Sulfopaludibacter sp.]